VFTTEDAEDAEKMGGDLEEDERKKRERWRRRGALTPALSHQNGRGRKKEGKRKDGGRKMKRG